MPVKSDRRTFVSRLAKSMAVDPLLMIGTADGDFTNKKTKDMNAIKQPTKFQTCCNEKLSQLFHFLYALVTIVYFV